MIHDAFEARRLPSPPSEPMGNLDHMQSEVGGDFDGGVGFDKKPTILGTSCVGIGVGCYMVWYWPCHPLGDSPCLAPKKSSKNCRVSVRNSTGCPSYHTLSEIEAFNSHFKSLEDKAERVHGDRRYVQEMLGPEELTWIDNEYRLCAADYRYWSPQLRLHQRVW